MSSTIQIKRTTVAGRVPTTADASLATYINTGELAINLPDGKLFSSNGSGKFEVGANLSSISVGGNTFFSNTSVVKITISDALTFADTTTQNTAFRVYNAAGVRIA